MPNEFETMRNHALLNVQRQMTEMMNAARRLGADGYKGQGNSFVFQAACASFNYLAALIFMERHSAEEFDRLNALASASPWSFAQLDIPEDELLMHGVMMARAFTLAIRMRKADSRGEKQPVFCHLNLLIRDAAREAVRLVGEAKASENVLNLSRQTDEQIQESVDRNQQVSDLLYSEPAGRA